jgi:ABC-type multidrug transport system fused ATPase/permease subunit
MEPLQSIKDTAITLWGMLNSKQKFGFINLVILLVIGALLEMLGIGLVLPVLALITRDDPLLGIPLLGSWLDILNNTPKDKLVLISVFILLIVYAVRTGFLSYLIWKQSKFVYGLQISWAAQLFSGYLKQEYSFHLERNSAEINRNIISQVGSLVNAVQQGLILLTEFLVLIAFTLCLLLVEPLGVMLVVGMLGGAAFALNQITRRRIQGWSETLQRHESKRVKCLQEGIAGVKDIKLLGRESEFISTFEVHNANSAEMMMKHSAMTAIPRLGLELLAVCGLVFLVIAMVLQGKPMDTLLPTLGVFGAAAFRLMPSVNRVIGALQNVRFAVPVVQSLSAELRLISCKPDPLTVLPITFLNHLTLRGVSFKYNKSNGYALKNININIKKGSIVGVVGGSGAGKSTLVDIILGLYRPTSGIVSADDEDIQQNLKGWNSKIGYVPQHIYLSDDSIRRNIAFGVPENEISEDAVLKSITAAQLDEFMSNLPYGIETLVGERGVRFSGGQRQRIGIARALYHNPELLVLDEATSALDYGTESAVMQAILSLKGVKTIIVVAHRLTTVEQCDWIYKIESGSIVQQGPADKVLK